MPIREHPPAGAPCWADLWTSDVEGSRRFYTEVFGWKADEPDPVHGGYFMFNRERIPVAGAMGPVPGMVPTNSWRPYLATINMEETLADAEALGANIVVPAMPVDDAGIQAVILDPTGAPVGVWQEGTFPGFTVLTESGAPSWFELYTRHYDAAVRFYEAAFGWQTEVVSDSEQFRYTVMQDPGGEGQLAGILDASSFLDEEEGSHWEIYWTVDDVDAAVTRVIAGGGAVLMAVEDSPYGRLATVADPEGAAFKLHSPNR